jgi:hypothetical protein
VRAVVLMVTWCRVCPDREVVSDEVGYNVYAVLSSPRGDGTESLVLSSRYDVGQGEPALHLLWASITWQASPQALLTLSLSSFVPNRPRTAVDRSACPLRAHEDVREFVPPAWLLAELNII